MNNEPVAYVTGVKQFDPVMADTVLKVGTPLYTHPAKTLTLTNEEIIEVYEKEFGLYNTPINFAWAILRKAQEK